MISPATQPSDAHAAHPRADDSFGIGAPVVALVVFGLLALSLSWPLPANLGSRIPGTATWAFDESTFVWNIWYFKHALIDLHVSPLHTDLIWYPLGIDLILFTYNFFNALIALPLQVAVSLPVASNVTLLLATALSALGAYLLASYTLRESHRQGRVSLRTVRLAAILAGIIYGFASNRAVYAALGHYDMVTTQWLPFFALYFLKTVRERKPRFALMTGLFFALAALAEMIFGAFLALLALVLLAVSWRSLRHRTVVLANLLLAGAIAAILWSPVLMPIVREFMRGDYALTGWGESLKLSADLVGLVTPTALNPLFSEASDGGTSWSAALRAVEEGKSRFSDINTVFLGWVTALLGLAGAWRFRTRLRPWIWTALVFGVLCLGPLLQVNGRFRFSLDDLLPEGVTLPLPFGLLHFVPMINANRAPNRYSVILMMALALLAAHGAAWLLDQMQGRGIGLNLPWARERRVAFAAPGLALLLASLVVAEHLAAPLPTTDARVPAIYAQIGSEPGEFAIMQLPLGWRNSFGVLGSEQTQLQYYQAVHGKPMIGGNISRAPDFKMEYFERIPLFKAITELEMYREPSSEVDAAARDQAGALMALYDVRYLITTPPIPGRYPYVDTWQRTEAYVLDVLPLEKPAFWEGDGVRAYRVIQPETPFPFRVDLGSEGVEPYLGMGWDHNPKEQPFGVAATWATDQTAEVYIPLQGSSCAVDASSGTEGGLALRLLLAPLSYEGAPQQTVEVLVNDQSLGSALALQPGWQTLELEVAMGWVRCGPNRVRLTFAHASVPRVAFPDPASRALIGATGVVSPLNLDVRSFDEAFISAADAQGSITDASAGRRGYNVAVFDEGTGRLLDRRGFDTAANTYESEALADYLASIPTGRIVILATKGDATAYLTPAALQAMRDLGSAVASPEELRGQAHALVGISGAQAGEAAEAVGPGDVFLRVAGDFRSLAAAVDWIELGP